MLKQKFQKKLEAMILKQVGLNKSRANFIALAVEEVLAYESVLQKKLAQPLSQGKTLPESSIRRVERFFADSQINTNDFSRMITHITDPERISKLFGIIAIACLLVVKAGSLRSLFKKIPVKNHGRPLFSIFTYGLDFMRNVFSSHFYRWEAPPIYRIILDRLFRQNIEKTTILGVKNVGY